MANISANEVFKFVFLCKKTQAELKDWVTETLRKYYNDIVVGDGYVYAKGTEVLLTAHLDTVHKEVVKDVDNKVNKKGEVIISSPQGIGGDDRCGVYMIFRILSETEFRPSILFCEDEEIGGVGSDKFCKTEMIDDLSQLKFLIELDRANKDDIVFYNDDNVDFHDWVRKVTGYKEAWGTFSDIGNLCPDCGIAGVNISCGYYHQHTLKEEVNMNEMEASIEATIKLLEKANEVEQFEYVEHHYHNYGYGYGYNYDWSTSKRTVWMDVTYIDKNGKTCYADTYGTNIDSCLVNFMQEHPTLCWNDIVDYEVYEW